VTEAGPGLLSLPWRTGRHLGRTIYARLGAEASDDDPVLGMMDSRELAEEACAAHNAKILHAAIGEGIEAAGRGETSDLGSFARYGGEDGA
jgi:hypothetical protein